MTSLYIIWAADHLQAAFR